MAEQRLNTFPILLAGGTGTRLWPVSRERHPKQLAKFIENESLLQSTVKRLTPTLDGEKIRIVCGQEHAHEIERHLEEIGIDAAGKIIREPCARNTGPAILLAVLEVMKNHEDAIFCVFPADHVIGNIDSFHKKLSSAIVLAEMGSVVTFGIKPAYPETGYGYIEGSGEIGEGARSIKRFVEKPDFETAKTYIADGNYFWNSGMFAFKTSVMIDEFKRLQPDLIEKMERLVFTGKTITREEYEQLPSISIDYAIMEKTDRGAVLPSDFGWSDIGTWKSLYDFLPKDDDNNVIAGDVIKKETENCLIMGYERLIATNHLSNTVVVETPDAVFISDMDHSRDANAFVAVLEEQGRKEHQGHKTDHYPWGSFTLLEQKEYVKVARIMLYPGSILQDEPDMSISGHLVVARGLATISTGEPGRLLNRGESTIISGSQSLRIENSGTEPLELILVDIDA